MSLNDHRNPNGTYDGIGVMSELTRIPRTELQEMAAKIRENTDRLAACKYHEFEQTSETEWAKYPGKRRYRCRRCGGEVDHSSWYWHQLGRRADPGAGGS